MSQQSANAVVMIRPSRFYPNPETALDNAFQGVVADAPEALAAQARAEFDGAAEALSGAGVTVHVFEDTPSPAKPDAVFPNNWFSTHHDGRVALYPMYTPSRRTERRLDLIDPFHEHRGVLEAHVRWPFPGNVLVSDRNRVDLRWVDGVYSWRYRNRLLVERETSIGGYRLTPYTSGEVFYDSRYEAWSRNRFALGVQAPFHPRLMLDIYYMRQNDTRSQPAHVNALGLALNTFF
jgi:hypothetical protein